MRGKQVVWTPEQQKAISRYFRHGKRDASSVRAFYSKLPEPRPSLSALQRHMRARRVREKKPARVTNARVIFEYETMRTFKAMHHDHSHVTSREISEKIQEDHGWEEKFKGRSRVSAAARGRPEVRDPVKDPEFGDRARLSQRKLDLKHHHRV